MRLSRAGSLRLHLRAHNDQRMMVAAMVTAMMSNNNYLGH
jgi:hypothetical protein